MVFAKASWGLDSFLNFPPIIPTRFTSLRSAAAREAVAEYYSPVVGRDARVARCLRVPGDQVQHNIFLPPVPCGVGSFSLSSPPSVATSAAVIDAAALAALVPQRV